MLCAVTQALRVAVHLLAMHLLAVLQILCSNFCHTLLQVPDCEAPEFWHHMDSLVKLNGKLSDIGKSGAPKWQQNLQKAGIFRQFAWHLGALYFGKTLNSGSYDTQPEAQLVY